jgi:hypothetical protein
MKKKMLFLMVCLLPVSIHAICFRYVSGPKDLDKLEVSVDATKIGSYAPTMGNHKVRLLRGEEKYRSVRDPDLLKGDTFYVSVKEIGYVFKPLLIQGAELDGKAAYDINIDNNKKVTFIKAHDSCEGKTYPQKGISETISEIGESIKNVF